MKCSASAAVWHRGDAVGAVCGRGRLRISHPGQGAETAPLCLCGRAGCGSPPIRQPRLSQQARRPLPGVPPSPASCEKTERSPEKREQGEAGRRRRFV